MRTWRQRGRPSEVNVIEKTLVLQHSCRVETLTVRSLVTNIQTLYSPRSPAPKPPKPPNWKTFSEAVRWIVIGSVHPSIHPYFTNKIQPKNLPTPPSSKHSGSAEIMLKRGKLICFCLTTKNYKLQQKNCELQKNPTNSPKSYKLTKNYKF